MDLKLLPNITSPEQIKEMTPEQLEQLAQEVRYKMVDTVSHTGGHLASNLGVVELTIAMHKVFSSPKDSFVWDVGHQVYTHKLLTGRYDQFDTLRQDGGISGFPNPEESEHDFFAAGHSGTSIAAAYGLSVAKTLQGDNSYTVAVIGDGSFTGGLVYEALNNAGNSNTNLIVILNENEMSISKNVGAMATYLAKIRTNPKYYRLKDGIRETLKQVPVVGDPAVKIIVEAKKRLKNNLYSSNFFEDLGFAYMGPIDGHNMVSLIDALESCKGFDIPVLLHVKTTKGKGYEFAEEHPSAFHGISKFDINTGECIVKGKDYSAVFGEALCRYAEKDARICGITAAMSLGTGLQSFSARFPKRFFDVGIAEEFAVTYAGGLAKGGMIPVFAVYSSFLQRAYDEMVHDVAMQNQKVVLGVDRAGFVGADGRSHQGIFDIAFLRTIPNSVIYSPSSFAEVDLFLEKALYGDGNLVAVRYPRGTEGHLPGEYKPTDHNFDVYGDADASIALVTFGNLFCTAYEAYEELKQQGVSLKIIKLNRVWPVGDEAVAEASKCDNIIFYEEGAKSGGIGEKFAYKLFKASYKGEYKYFAVDNTFVHHAPVNVLLKEFHLDKDSMKNEVLKRVKE